MRSKPQNPRYVIEWYTFHQHDIRQGEAQNAHNFFHFFIVGVQLSSYAASYTHGLFVAGNICTALSCHVRHKVTDISSSANCLHFFIKGFSQAD